MKTIRLLTTALKLATMLLMATNVSQAQMVAGIGDPDWIASYDSPTTQTIRLEWLPADPMSPTWDVLYENLYDAGNGVWTQELGQVTYAKWRTIYQDPATMVTYIGDIRDNIEVEVKLDDMTAVTLQNPHYVWREDDMVKVRSIWNPQVTWTYPASTTRDNREVGIQTSVGNLQSLDDWYPLQDQDLTNLRNYNPATDSDSIPQSLDDAMPGGAANRHLYTLPMDQNGDWSGWWGAAYGNPGASAQINSTITWQTGLCMTTPALGSNGSGWASESGIIPLMDQVVYDVLVTVSHDNGLQDGQALWSIGYSNYNGTTIPGNTYGGDTFFFQKLGNASGIGQWDADGHYFPLPTTFRSLISPIAMLTPQWRGETDGADGDGMFSPAMDAFNDMGLIIRVFDDDNMGVDAQHDWGTMCVSRIRVSAKNFDVTALQANGQFVDLWTPPIHASTHAPQTFDQASESSGTATINNSNNTARIQLTESGAGSRKTVLPYNQTNPSMSWREQLYPVTWTDDTVVLATVEISAATTDTDPVDFVGLGFDGPTSELISYQGVLAGTAPGNFYRAGSPRNPSLGYKDEPGIQIGPQSFMVLMYTNNASRATDIYPHPDGQANRLRPLVDFMNFDRINPGQPGSDAVVVHTIEAREVTNFLDPITN